MTRQGLPSRIAAMTAIQDGGAAFVDGTGMREWLESNEITAFTTAGDWPTPKTAALWRRFREDVLSGGIQRRNAGSGEQTLDFDADAKRPPIGLY